MLLLQKMFSWLLKNPIIIVGILLFLSVGYIKILIDKVATEKSAKVLAQNNFNALSKGTTVWKTRSGNLAAYAEEQKLTINQLKTSSDKRISSLLKAVDDMNLKLKESTTLVSTYGLYIANFKIKTVHDTIIGAIKYLEYEKYQTKNLTLIRHKVSIDTASYEYNYHINLFAVINSFKDGKWKLKNIFTPRKRINKLDITSDDDNFKIDSLLLITNMK